MTGWEEIVNEIRNKIGRALEALGRRLQRPRLIGGSMAREIAADAAPQFWKVNPPSGGIDSEGGFVPTSDFVYEGLVSEPDIGVADIVDVPSGPNAGKYLRLNPGKAQADGSPRLGFAGVGVNNSAGKRLGILSADAVIIHGTAVSINDGSLTEVEGDPTVPVEEPPPTPEEPPTPEA